MSYIHDDDSSSNVQLQVRLSPELRQEVKIEAALREVRVCRFVQEAIREKIARERAAREPARGGSNVTEPR